jgi:hypothetical protein
MTSDFGVEEACRWGWGKRANNKHFSKILQDKLFTSVSNDLLPFMVGQRRDSFTLLCQVCYFSIVSRPLKWCARGIDRRHSEANL